MKKTLLKTLEKILAELARIYLRRTMPYVIGITGSVGKTSCRMIVSQVLEKYLTEKTIYTSPKNFNSELGLVFSIFKIEKYTPGVFSLLKMSFIILFKSIFTQKKYDILVLEYGVDHPGDMDFLLSIVKPNISIFTKLDTVHSEYFDTDNGIGEEKIKLIFQTKQKTYLNPLDDFCRMNFEKIRIKKSYFPEISDYTLDQEDGVIFSEFQYKNHTIKTNIIGIENIVYVGLGLGILEEIQKNNPSPRASVLPLILKEEVIELELQPGRYNIFEGIHDSVLIDSTYNASPASMKKMIENTYSLRDALFPEYKIGLILGDMRELGNIAEDEHKNLFESVKEADIIITVGEEMKTLISELKKNHFSGVLQSFLKSNEAGKSLTQLVGESDTKYILLFKGSQNTVFVEEALKVVLKNSSESTNLVRQSPDWIMKKKKFFAS